MGDSVPRRTSSALRVALALGTVYLIWGSTYLAIRITLESIPPFFMAGARFLTAGVLLYGWARWRGAARPTAAQWRTSFILGALLLLGGNGGVVWAEQKVDSGLAALLVSTEPLWIVLLLWLQGGNRPRLRVAAGLLLGFAGVALLLRPSTGAVTHLAGAAVLLLSSASWATGSLYSLRAPQPRSPLLSTAMQMLCGGCLLSAAGLLSGETARFHLDQVTVRSAGALAYLIVFGAMVCFSAYVWLLRSAPPVLASTYAYVNPVVAVLLGWAILHEPISRGTVIAAAVILAGVALIVTAPKALPAAVPGAPAVVDREDEEGEAKDGGAVAYLEDESCVSAVQ
jgi:drug/metabolite transporter (DMT)-like permease